MAQDNDEPALIKHHSRRIKKCWWCQNNGNQERTFSRRLTPLMRTADGRRHTEETIIVELEEEAARWKKTKLLHPKCEKEALDVMLQLIDQLDEDAERWKEVEIKLVERSSEPAVAALMEEIGLRIADRPVSV